MKEYEFLLKFRLLDAEENAAQHVGALVDTGCDDAIIGVDQRGRVALDFTRKAHSALDAIMSAVRDVRRAIPGAQLIEASPDLVGLSDVAGLVGCSRQNIRKLMLGHASFPVPMHEGSQSLWHLMPILEWLSSTQRYSIDRTLVETAEAVMKLNIAKESQHLPGTKLPEELDPILT